MTTERDWSVRLYRDGDETGMLDCINAAFGAWPAIDIDVSPIEHLRWKLGPPVAGRRYHIIVETGDRIIGCGLVRPCRVKLGDVIAPAVLYGDMAVRPEYQNKGIMGAVWDYQDEVGETFDLSIGISDNRYVGKEFEKRTRNRPIANEMELLECSTWQWKPTEGDVLVQFAERFDARINPFAVNAMRPFQFGMARDELWLNYRFADWRAGRYAVRLAVDGGRIAGYSVLTVVRGNGFIADLLALPANEGALGALLSDAGEYFAQKGIDRVRCWLPAHHPYRRMLEASGFQSLRGIGMLYPGYFRDTDLNPVFDDPTTSVHYMAGDTDVV